MIPRLQGVKGVVKMVEVQIPKFLHAQMKIKKIWNIILQNCTVAILDVNRSFLQISQQFICMNLRERYEELVNCNLLYITFLTFKLPIIVYATHIKKLLEIYFMY